MAAVPVVEALRFAADGDQGGAHRRGPRRVHALIDLFPVELRIDQRSFDLRGWDLVPIEAEGGELSLASLGDELRHIRIFVVGEVEEGVEAAYSSPMKSMGIMGR